MQAGHIPKTANTTYRKLYNKALGVLRPLREQYCKIFMLWHKFWLDFDLNIAKKGLDCPNIDEKGPKTPQSSHKELPEPILIFKHIMLTVKSSQYVAMVVKSSQKSLLDPVFEPEHITLKDPMQ